MKIYLARNNVQAGPYTLDELNIMLSSGEVVLEDLMWHQGMANWQKVGEMTAGQLRYQPSVTITPPVAPTTTTQSADVPKEGFGSNPDFRKSEQQRVSVAELYGKKLQEPTQSHNAQAITQKAQDDAVVHASILSRVGALLINLVMLVLVFLPFVLAFTKLNPDVNKMNAGSLEARMAYAQTLAEQIPGQVGVITTLMLLAFVFVQLALIVNRGQSFGKLLMGIRTVDAKTFKLSGLGSRLGIRTVLLVVIYYVASMLPFGAFVLVFLNYIMAATNKDKQGWHDKLAKTIVVKANDSQLKR